jgi:hypothetical protein
MIVCSNRITDRLTLSLHSFEHSLVKELGYTGYERLRRGFDRAFGGQDKVPNFPKVIDAGCGTGLVGEQVSIIILFAYPIYIASLWSFLICLLCFTTVP